jgi:hypothetical protein
MPGTMKMCNVIGLAFVASAVACESASAGFVPIDQFANSPLILNFYIDGNPVLVNGATGTIAPGLVANTFTSVGSANGSGWSANWNVLFDPDPFVNASLEVVNESAITQTFTLDFYMPISIDMNNPEYHGNVTGSVRDNNGDGATLATLAGQSMYSALLNDSIFSTLIDDPTSFVAPASQTVGMGFSAFGSPDGGVAGPSLLAGELIGIRLNFSLSAGDSATFDANFTVAPASVPAPAALSLLALGALGLGGRRRR